MSFVELRLTPKKIV